MAIPPARVYAPLKQVAAGALYDPLHANHTARGADEQAIRVAIAPMMRPGNITSMMARAGRRIKFYAPVFLDMYAPNELKGNSDYVALVSSLCTPTVPGARGERSAQIVVQACATGYTAGDMATPAEAKARVSQGIKSIWNSLPDAIKNDVRGEGAQDPDWVAGDNAVTDAHMALILERAAELESQRATSLSIITSGILAYCKQGTVTASVLTKVSNGIRDELGVNTTLDATVIRSVWNMIGSWFTPEVASTFFDLWEHAIGDSCLRLRLLVQQASWTGMTNYTNIGKAKSMFPDFPWAKCAALFGAEFTRYEEAVRVVRGDKYYGYKKDLGAAKSTHYPNLCYTAYALLMGVGGDRTLRDFQGTNKSTPYASHIDVLVREYENLRKTMAERDPTAAETALAQSFQNLRPEEAPPAQ